MKTLLYMFAFLAISLSVHAQYTDPLLYNEAIVEEQNKIAISMSDFAETIEWGSDEQVENAYAVLKETIAQSVIGLDKIGPFQEDAALYKAAKDLFVFYKDIIGGEYREMIDIMKKENPTDEDLARMDAISAKITELETKYDNAFATAQEAFAAKHGFELTPPIDYFQEEEEDY